ncbi:MULTISPECIES: hypothetical protein [unclassified Clostridium]|uniref:hypothetical protein n=1 Tax=unclassified Clostridium TaxID=2614128 RepID=UPI0013EE4959|nr:MULTISPECIES: hypothetical protein [unclassified Clostridium]MBZ9693451.1 hypothetical protein [Clostridium sp. M14]
MATKLYNSHLSKIIFECNEYYILDTYISLAYISSEVNSKYLIQTFSDSKADLINLVRRNMNASYKTIFNCIDKLIEKSILSFDNELHSWVLVHMENMTKSKYDSNNDSYMESTGYTNIRNFFFTDEFRKMKAREKRLIIYMSQLCDSKGSKFHDSFSMNLLKPNSSWMKVLKTKSKYYARYTINKMFTKYEDVFKDNSETMRTRDLSPKKTTNFKFYFQCPAIDTKVLEDQYIELVKLNNPKEYEMVKEKIKFGGITLTKKLIMHLVRALSNLKEWFLKERVAQLIINKYIAIQIHKSRENIKSLPAYAAAVVKSVVNEYKNFKKVQNINNIRRYEHGEYFIEYTKNKANDDINFDIKKALALL